MRKFTFFYKDNCLLKCGPLLGGGGAIARPQPVGSDSPVPQQVQSGVGEPQTQLLTLCEAAWRGSQAAFLDSHPSGPLIGNVTDHSMPLCYLLLI